jgi:hypothetical protein
LRSRWGDFFQAVPPGGDLYVFKFNLDRWKEAEAIRILKHSHHPRRQAARSK